MANTGSTAQALDTNWSGDLVSVRTVARHLVLASYERSAVTDLEYAQSVVKFAESTAEKNRRAGIARRMQIVRDAWGPLLKASFANWTTEAVAAAVMGRNGDHLDLSRNPAKNIWSELAVCYKLPPKRSTPKDPKQGERYVELLDGTQFDLFWQLVELVLQACNEVLVWPDVVQRGDGSKVIKHRYAAGDTAVIVTTEEDPTEIEAVMLLDEYDDLSGVSHKRYVLWTDAWHAAFEADRDGNLQRIGAVEPPIRPEDDDSSKNPYGALHLTLIRQIPWGDAIWDATSGEDLVDLTVKGGEERQFYRYQQKMGGFKQLVVTGAGIEDMPEQLMDPAAIGKVVGHDISTQVVDWQTDLKSRLECMMIDELAAAASRGINPERYKKTANYQTGFGARMSERGLVERRVRQAQLFALAEQSYYRAFCRVLQAHEYENVPDASVPLLVEHAPMEYPEAPLDQLSVEEKELAMGLESQVSLLQRRRPEMTADEAKQQLTDNMEIIGWVNEQKAARNIPDVPTNESRSAEQNGMAGPVMRDAMRGGMTPGRMAPGKPQQP